MKVVDLFSGVGGLSCGFTMAGAHTVAAVEHDRDIAECYAKNHPTTEVINSDISVLDPQILADKFAKNKPQIIVGGPPCQGFSQKGKRLFLEDDRNYLFQYFCRLVDRVRPEAFCIENVPTILTAQKGYFFDRIRSDLASFGYTLSAKILNAADFGVPQTRRRAFIVGVRRGINFRFPEPLNQRVTLQDALSDLPKLRSGEGSYVMSYTLGPQTAYQSLLRMGSRKIHNHIATRHSAIALERLALIPENGGRSSLPVEHLTKSIYSGTWCRLRRDSPAPTITTRFDTPSSGQFTLPDQDRCLTVREAARLQSFPDTFIFTGSKSSQMIQVGNAVPPILANLIAGQLFKALGVSKN